MIAGQLMEATPAQFDLLAGAAETSNAQRRARGRPAGAGNLRNEQTFDYLEALGFKAPERRLMEVISADPRQLAAALAGHNRVEDVPFDRALDVLKLQLKAAGDLLPYKLAKKPQSIEVKKGVLHVFVAGNMMPEGLSTSEQNQWLSVVDSVREKDNPSHDVEQSQQDQGLDGAAAADRKTAVEE